MVPAQQCDAAMQPGANCGCCQDRTRGGVLHGQDPGDELSRPGVAWGMSPSLPCQAGTDTILTVNYHNSTQAHTAELQAPWSTAPRCGHCRR